MKSAHVVVPRQRADAIVDRNKYDGQPQQEKASAGPAVRKHGKQALQASPLSETLQE
jgi:hypothetical protein